MARSAAAAAGPTATIRATADQATGHQSKDLQLDFPPKATKALSSVRKLLEKVKNIGDIESIITDNSRVPVITRQLGKATSRGIDGLSEQEAELLVASLHVFVTAVTRNRVSRLTADLFIKELQRLKLPESTGIILAGLVFRNLDMVNESRLVCPLNRLRRIKWRLDVIITSHAGKRLLEPLFLMELKTDSKTVVFEVPLTQFHKMRYGIAALLKETQNLSARKIMAPS